MKMKFCILILSLCFIGSLTLRASAQEPAGNQDEIKQLMAEMKSLHDQMDQFKPQMEEAKAKMKEIMEKMKPLREKMKENHKKLQELRGKGKPEMKEPKIPA